MPNPNCSVKELMERDSRYQMVKSWYGDTPVEWYEVANHLQRYREKTDKTSDYYPTADQKEEYLSFVSHYKKVNKKRNQKLLRRLNSKPLRETIDVYKAMLKLGYNRTQLESRMNLIKTSFSNQVRAITAKVFREEGKELSIPAAIRRLGGYQKVLDKAFNSLAKATTATEYDYLVKSFGEPKDENQKKLYRERAEQNAKELNKIAENKERFATLATREIANSFGLVVNHNGIEMSLESYKDNEDEEDKQNDDTGGSGGDRYIDVRTKKIMDTISTETKAFLSTIPMTDNGRKVLRDDLLRPRFLDPRQIAYILPSILRFSTPETMISDLREASDRYPFLTNLANKLDGVYKKSDKNYQALIYTNFKRAANLYGYIDLNRGSYRANKANTRAQGNALVRSASRNMGGTRLDKTWSIYDDGGLISRKIDDIANEVKTKLSDYSDKLGFVNMASGGFDKRKSYTKKGEPTHYADYTEYSKLAQEKGGEVALQKFLEDYPDVVSDITRASRGIGLDLNEYQVRNALLSPVNSTTAKILGQKNEDNQKGTNRLVSIINELISVYDEASKKDGKNSTKLKHKTARDVGNTVSKEFTKLNSAFAVSFFDELEPRVLIENSSVQTYIYPSLIHDTMDALNNEAQLDQASYNEFLDKEYLRYDDMTLAGKPTGWLKRLRDGSAFTFAGNEGMQSGPYKLVHMTAFNHVEYKDLSIPQKIAAQLVMWGSMNHAVECTIQADYANAWDFIQNAGIEPGNTAEEIDEIVEQRVAEELAKFREINGKAPSFNDKVKIRTRVENQVTVAYGSLRRPDGTYNTKWPVVQEIADEVLIEVNRIARLWEDLRSDPDGLHGPRMAVYDRQGLKFQIFPEFNDNGFYDKYISFDSDVDAREFVENQVAEQLAKRVEKDFAYLERTKALTNPILESFSVDKRSVSLYSPTGKIEDLPSASALLTLQNFFLDYYYGRVQMVKLMNGGLQQFDGLLDFEKRNMMNHATRRPAYTEAYWNGEKVGRTNQSAVYLEDDISESAYYDDISEMLGVLNELGYIDDRHRDQYKASYERNNSTDGQGFRYYPSYRIIQIELGKWDDERERVYNYLMFNEGMASKEEIANEMQRIYNPNEKPVYTGWEIVNNVRTPVLHKYSETVLFPEKVLRKLMGNQIPAQLLGMAKAAAKLNTAKQPFDIFLFHSCVKVGAHTLIDPFGFVTEEYIDEKTGQKKERVFRDDDGKPVRKCQTADEIADYIKASVDTNPWAVHVLPMKYYGEAASTPAHGEDDEISWSSQAQKDLWGNVEASDELLDERLTIDGHRMKSSEARDIDDEIDAATAAAHYKEIQEIFDDPDELHDVLMEELAGKSYSSPELEYAINSGKVPYFYPSIARGAEQLFSSIIKKRMTRPKTKGANLLQVTSLGWDVDPFGHSFGTSDKRKLHIVFEGKGKDKRIKWIECYMPIHDKRLEKFADENGEITPEKLQDLVDKKIIPEDLLNFVAYRTPSDDIHSILPLRIKGFTSKARGANIIIPKEVMKMTGHDFDGDKLRCHFQDFHVKVDDNVLMEKYLEEQAKEENIVKGMLGEDNAATQKYEAWKKEYLSRSENYTAGMIQMYQYDYSKKAWENSQEQRDNAKVQLAFAQLTSPSGSRRMLIPGGSADTDVYGATFHITRALHDDKSLANKLDGFGIDFTDDVSIYKSLRNMDGKTLARIMDIVNGNVVPFSFEHSNEAFEYMMGGKKMISVYALYASAGQMLQRLNLKVNQGKYKDKKTKEIRQYNIGFFGKPIDYLYKIVNNKDQLGSLTQSEFINSAVDNGKNPRLGYLNQDTKLAEMTNYLCAANLGAEQIHLILNQPVMIEVVRRMKEQNISFKNAARQVKEELINGKENLERLGYLKKASENIFKLSEDAYIRMMPMHYEDIRKSTDEDLLGNQIGLLSVLLNQNKYAMLLSKYIKGTRPEATSNGIGSVLAKTMVITSELRELRENVLDNELDEEDIIENEEEKEEGAENEKEERVKQDALIEGLSSVITPVNILDDDSEEVIADKLSKSKIKRITALEALMQDKVYRFFAPYFPQAKEQWRRVLDNIVDRFSASQREKEAIYRNVGNEMILWNLLKSPAFSTDVHEDGRELVINFPKKFTEFQTRVKNEKYRMERGEKVQDTAARSMVDNVFIDKLAVDDPQGESEKPRLFFHKGGVTMDNYAEKITYDWAMMSVSPHEEIRKMAVDLFKYNAFTSGFGYGMYEFAHFAPYTVLEQVPGYLDSLNAIKSNSLFTDSANDVSNFLLQLYSNHWGDQRLVKRFKAKELPNVVREKIGIKLLGEKENEKVAKVFPSLSSMLMFSVEGKSETRLFMPLLDDNDRLLDIVEVPKLGHRTKRNQVYVQYEPKKQVTEIEPHQAGLDSAWGDFGANKIQDSEASDINTETMTEEERAAYADSITSDDYQQPVKHYGEEVEAWSNVFAQYSAKQEENVRKNDAALAKMKKDTTPTSTEASREIAEGGIEAALAKRARGEVASPQTGSTKSMFTSVEPESNELAFLTRIEVDSNGVKHVVTRTANWTPDVVRQTREQKAYVALNKKLREEIFPRLGIATAALTHADARLAVQGITDFSKVTEVNANGLRELIRLAEGYRGEEALPEEFAHLALEMLGHDHHLVRRLLNQLQNNERALKEAFEGQYEQYHELYKGDENKLLLEAAGKLLAKSLLQEIQIQTPEVRPLIKRIIDAIKELLRKIGSWQIWNAIMDAHQLSSQLARDIISGRILDDMSFENISRSDSFAQVQKNLNDKKGLLNDILKRETKRLALLKKRAGPISKDQKSAAMIATEKQISILEDAIRNHKVESALVDYLTNSLQFLKDTEASLDNKVMYGDKVNSICRELNKVRDTLYSYASVMKLINDAVESGEIVPSGELRSITKDVKDEMDKFMTKYEHLGMRFFERMLANVYGEHGVTRTLGKDRGKILTIEEMARRGDRDIGLMTRLLSSLADCGDYVLAAFDDVTRKAKIAGRQRAAEAHRRVLVAFDKLVSATGSKDQSFMFEMEKGEDGKMHRTGDYISNEKAKRTLTKPQYEFYKEMLAIKHDIDDCLPPVMVTDEYRIVALRKFGLDRIKGAEGIKGKLDAFGENVKNSLLDNSEEADKEERSVQVDFQGNKIDNLPLKYTTKGRNESWDDMTDDVAMSIIAYASMGYEYDELNQVIAMLENARYMSMNRDIQQRSGWQRLVERVKTGTTEDDFAYDEPFTKKQMHTNMQKAIDDFFQMHLYGKLQKEEGGILGTKVSARKVSNAINAAASYSQMAFNLQQRISNVGAGVMNIAVETAGKGAFDAASFAWATKEYMRHSGRRILETGALESKDKLSLFAERYDLHQNNGKVNKSFNKSRASRTFNTNLLFAGLNMGEDFLALTTALAIAKKTEVKYKDANGNWHSSNLWDAFEVKYSGPDNTGAYLQIKDGYVMADGSPIDRPAEEKFAKLVIGTNFRLQGIYNSDDKSAIQQYAFGSLVMMYRKWMHPAIVRRYGKAGYNPLTGQEGEGYWRTVAGWIGESFKETLTDEEGNRVAMNIIERLKTTVSNMHLNKSKMTDYEKSNLARALVEFSSLMGICLALMLHSKFGPDKKKNEKDFGGWFDSMAVYQLFRLRNEMGSVAPTPLIFNEIKNTLSSPIAAIEPMQRMARIPLLLLPGTWTNRVKSGSFKGKRKAEKIIFELPILSLYKQIQHVIDPTPLINYYKNDLTF